MMISLYGSERPVEDNGDRYGSTKRGSFSSTWKCLLSCSEVGDSSRKKDVVLLISSTVNML